MPLTPRTRLCGVPSCARAGRVRGELLALSVYTPEVNTLLPGADRFSILASGASLLLSRKLVEVETLPLGAGRFSTSLRKHIASRQKTSNISVRRHKHAPYIFA